MSTTQTIAQALSYPSEAVDASDELSKVLFFGRGFTSDERDALLSAEMSLTTDMVSQITLRLADPNLDHLNSGLFQANIPVAYEDLLMDVGSVEVSNNDGTPQVEVRCRPRVVRLLKQRTGSKVMKNASPTAFVRAECKAIGAKVVAQPSSKRKQVARDKKKTKGSTEAPSSWTTFKRLADDLGYVVFESMDTIFFGKPTWIMEQMRSSYVYVYWNEGDEALRCLGVPTVSRNEDRADASAEVQFDVPRERAKEFRPGRALRFSGITGWNGDYMIKEVSYSLLKQDQPIGVKAVVPIDPKAGKGGGAGRTSSLRYLLQKAGFKGEGLETAIAVAMSESGGDGSKQNKADITTKWSGYYGLFQVRALYKPADAEGLNKKRIQNKLMDPEYNAKFVYELTNKGSKWDMFPTFASGAYKQFKGKKKDYSVAGWSTKLPQKKTGGGSGEGVAGSGSAGTGATGAKSAGAFVSVALAQAGDRYVFGAEAAISNPNPSAFDCSELVQWAAGRVGVSVPDGSSAQIAFCRAISVEQAIRTRGALLWSPGHIAISLGNGRTIEAANSRVGVVSYSAAGRFSRGGLIPNMRY